MDVLEYNTGKSWRANVRKCVTKLTLLVAKPLLILSHRTPSEGTHMKQLFLSGVSRSVWEEEEGRRGQWMVSGCACSSLARSPGISRFCGCLKIARQEVKSACRGQKARC